MENQPNNPRHMNMMAKNRLVIDGLTIKELSVMVFIPTNEMSLAK